MMHQRSTLRPARPSIGAPTWLRYSVIAAATLIMCSCRATTPGGSELTIRGQSPDQAASPAAFTRSPQRDGRVVGSQYAVSPLPTHLTPAQIQQAQCLPEGCSFEGCSTGCSCCNNCPVRGPNDEYLCDGGDQGLPAGVRADWRVTGLESEDTIAHYDTLDGRTVVTPSNKVCIYAPRFGVVRRIVDPVGYDQSVMVEAVDENAVLAGINEREQPLADVARLEPVIDRVRQPPSLLRERQQAGELDRDRRVATTIGSLAPYANFTVISTGEIVGRDIVEIARSSLAAITWAGNQAVQVTIDADQAQAGVSVQSPGTVYQLKEPNSPRLRLIKLASTDTAKPGEEVEFTLRYDNVGDRVIGNVTIVDNLTTRLEYVDGTQKSSDKADFSTEANDGGSLLLRWEITEPLEPGQGGVLQFKTRVR
ncbi:MAG: hypothetical protein KDA44_14785 [Planctomycetales bacterium]|nr:hypothetical protein [Planctomycetales bacterium]